MNTDNVSQTVEHPGEKLNALIKTLGMSQKELAVRTGFSEKHISTVINGGKDISPSFAKRLGYVFDMKPKYWMDAQFQYDEYRLAKEERNHIRSEETGILKRLRDVVEYLKRRGLVQETLDEIDAILELRKFMGISNLCLIPKITYNAAYRAQLRSNYNIDPYVLFAWQRMCEKLTENIHTSEVVNVKRLLGSLDEIKRLMFGKACNIQSELQDRFASCGIKFGVVKHFTGAPVQGFIKETQDGKLLLCLTLRQGRQDIFWFTLFHEVGHIVYGDVKQRFVDFTVKSDIEERADKFASSHLINGDAYRSFVMNGDFSPDAIHSFAVSQGVPNHIVEGRMLHDGYLEYGKVRMPLYKWAEG